MHKVLTAITVIGALALAIPASGFNVTITAPEADPWAVQSNGAWVAAPWGPWHYGTTKTADVPIGTYGYFGMWAQYPHAVTFDVDGSGLIQNIAPEWGGNGAGTSTLTLTPPTVEYGFFGNHRTGLIGLNGPGLKGWVGDGDHTTSTIWPAYTGRSYTWRHVSAPSPPEGEVIYLSFRLNEDGKVYDMQPETGGKFSIDGTGKGTLDTDDGGLECGGSYVQGDAELNSPSAAIDAAVLAQFNSANSNLAAVEAKLDNLPAGPQGPQGTAGADGTNGSDGPQGPQGKVGADGADGADAPCIDCQAISDAAFNLACIQLAANPATTVSDFQSSVDALATVSIVGSGDNICEPIPGGAATCMDYINDQAQAIYDSKP